MSTECERIFCSSLESAKVCYQMAEKDGTEWPVVFIFDMRYKGSVGAAVRLLGPERVKEHLLSTKFSVNVPVLICSTSNWKAISCLGNAAPRIKTFLNATAESKEFR